MSLPKNTLLSRLYHEKSSFRSDQLEEREIVKGERCLIERTLEEARLVPKEALLIGCQSEGLFFQYFHFFNEF